MQFSSLVKFSAGPILSTGIFIAPGAYVATGLEPFKYVAEEILENPMFRSTQTIILSLLIRFLFALLACVETFRCMAYIYTFALVILSRWKTILATPIVFSCNLSKLCSLHVQYRLIFKAIQTILETLLCTVFTWIFWGIVFITWICVQCSPLRIGFMLYIWLIILLLLLLIVVNVVISLPCKLLELDSFAVFVNILMAKRKLIRRRTKQNRVVFYRALAVRPLQLKCGMFACLGREFLVDFVWILLARCFDAIIIFHY